MRLLIFLVLAFIIYLFLRVLFAISTTTRKVREAPRARQKPRNLSRVQEAEFEDITAPPEARNAAHER